MAIVKGLSLDAIRSLKGTITFSSWKGKLIAKKKMGPIGPNRSPAVTIMNNRYRVACYYLKTLTDEIIDLLKEYTDGTDWTWKDAFISIFLRAWAESNSPPIVNTTLIFSWGSPIAKLQFAFADWYYGSDFGYGTDGYGRCPYGTPADLTENQPHAIDAEYLIGYSHPRPTPYTQWHEAQSTLGCKKPPPITEKETKAPDKTETPSITNIPIQLLDSQKKSSGAITRATCALAFADAWDKLINNPIPGIASVEGALDMRSVPAGANTTVTIFTITSTYEIDYGTDVLPSDWYKVESIRFGMLWFDTDDLAPWKLTLQVGDGPIVDIDADQSPVIVPVDPWPSLPTLVTLSHNFVAPAAPCPPPITKWDILTEVFSAFVVWKSRQPQTANENAVYPMLPWGVDINDDGHGLPITSAPIEMVE